MIDCDLFQSLTVVSNQIGVATPFFPLVLLHGNIYCPLYLYFILFKANAVNIGEGNWQRLWKVSCN